MQGFEYNWPFSLHHNCCFYWKMSWKD